MLQNSDVSCCTARMLLKLLPQPPCQLARQLCAPTTVLCMYTCQQSWLLQSLRQNLAVNVTELALSIPSDTRMYWYTAQRGVRAQSHHMQLAVAEIMSFKIRDTRPPTHRLHVGVQVVNINCSDKQYIYCACHAHDGLHCSVLVHAFARVCNLCDNAASQSDKAQCTQ